MPRGTIAQPDIHPWIARFAWLACLAGTFGIILSSTAGSASTLGAVLFLGSWMVVASMLGPHALHAILRSPILLLLPAIILASVLWSDHPLITLRAGVQYALTAGFALLAARLLTVRAFVGALTLSLMVAAALSVGFGRSQMDYISGTRAFMGIFASKNQLAFFMALLTVFGTATALDGRQPSWLRLAGGLAVLLAVPLLWQARSAGALVTTILSLGAFFAVMLAARLQRTERAILGSGALLLLAPFSLLLLGLALAGTLNEVLEGFVTEVLGKSLTLTGRTVIWQQAAVFVEQRPWLGGGYQAFWVHGNPWAEGIWRAFGIVSRSGFHFHNTFVDTAVGLGLVGAGAFVLLLATGVRDCFRRALAEGTASAAAVSAGLACLAARAFVEVDATYPFAIGTFLLFASAAYGRDHARQDVPRAAILQGEARPLARPVPLG